MAATAQNGDIMVGSVRNMVDRLSKDFSASKPPMSIHEPRKPLLPKPTNPTVVVTFPYKAVQEDELTLRVGDVVEVLEEVEDGWSRGRVQQSGDVGMFPTNFVESRKGSSAAPSGVSSAAPAAAAPTNVDSTTTSTVVVKRPSADDKPEAIRRTPSVIGAPSNNNSVPSTVTTFGVAPKGDVKTKEMARVKFIYEPEHPDELRLGEIGALIEIVRKDCGDAGWFEGELNGKTGLFPDNFVELVQVPASHTSGSSRTSTASASPAAAVSASSSTKSSYTPSKTPIVAPAGAVAMPPAVPAKPLKPKLSDSSTSLNNAAVGPPVNTSTKPVSSKFADIQNKIQQGLKVVAPGDAIPQMSKSTIVSSSGSSSEPAGPVLGRPLSTMENRSEDSGEQSGQLTHIIKDRPRAPSKRPMSMMMLRKKGSTENLLDSPTSTADSPAVFPPQPASSASPTLTSNNQSSFSQPAGGSSPSRSVALRPPFSSSGESASSNAAAAADSSKHHPVHHSSTSASTAQHTVSSHSSAYSHKIGASSIPTPSSSKPSSTVFSAQSQSSQSIHLGPNGDSEFVTRREYNDLLAKVSLLEARLAALESK